MEASIKLSYDLLSSDVQGRWRSLGVFPDTFDAAAAAALWQAEADAAADALGDLLKYSMLEWNETARRYRLHDLMRDFARTRLQETGEEDEAALRHATYYANVLAQADALYYKGGDSIKPGLALFDLEWGNIQAGQAWAAANLEGNDQVARLCSRYAGAGAYCQGLRLHPRVRVVWLTAALSAARRLKDRASEGRHVGNLGIAQRLLGDAQGAVDSSLQALAIAREIQHQQIEANALGNLGTAYALRGDIENAIEVFDEHLTLARQIQDKRGESSTLGNLGAAYKSSGQFTRATEFINKALAFARESGYRDHEANALLNLGTIDIESREFSTSIDKFVGALLIARDIGDRSCESNALGNLGTAHYGLGNYGQALKCYEQQLTIAEDIGDPRGEATALWNRSEAREKLGEREKAIEDAEAALKIYEQIEAPEAAMVRKQLEEWRS